MKVLLKAGANIEDHNENGHTPLMEAASAGHVEVARVLLEYGAGINTHSNEFKESALTLACYKGIVSCFGLCSCLNLNAHPWCSGIKPVYLHPNVVDMDLTCCRGELVTGCIQPCALTHHHPLPPIL